MLKNFWYACEFSAAVTNKPKQVLILNQRFVLYRNSRGKVIALQDICPHRGAALSAGKVKNNCIACPYHGWKFQEDGSCVEIPANPSGASIPKKARVASYPVQEKYGFIWMFYGDLPEAERPPIPPLPEFDDPTKRPIYFEYKVKANYTRTVENDMDLSHVYLIHKNTFGNQFQPEQIMKDYALTFDKWSGRVVVDISNFKNATPTFKYLFKPLRSNLKIGLGYYMPNITRVDVESSSGKLTTLTIHLPIDDQTTMTKRIQFRNFLKFPLADYLFQLAAYQVVNEDKRVVETQLGGVPDNLSDEVHVACDSLSIAYRQLRQKCLAMGWGLKPNQNQSDDLSLNSLPQIISTPESSKKESIINSL